MKAFKMLLDLVLTCFLAVIMVGCICLLITCLCWFVYTCMTRTEFIPIHPSVAWACMIVMGVWSLIGCLSVVNRISKKYKD